MRQYGSNTILTLELFCSNLVITIIDPKNSHVIASLIRKITKQKNKIKKFIFGVMERQKENFYI